MNIDLAAREIKATKRERTWDFYMVLSAPVGGLLGVSTFVNGSIWLPAAIAAGGYVVTGMFVVATCTGSDKSSLFVSCGRLGARRAADCSGSSVAGRPVENECAVLADCAA